jgi:hypothetical protein
MLDGSKEYPKTNNESDKKELEPGMIVAWTLLGKYYLKD